MSKTLNKPQTSMLKTSEKTATHKSSLKSQTKAKKNTQSDEMKSIMMDWHKPVYHKSSFSVSADMVTNTDTVTSTEQSEEENRTMCRICQALEDSLTNQQVTPCGCAGSLQYVHMDCLRQWRLTQKAKGADVSQCELCKQPYNIKLLGESDVPTNTLLKMQEDLRQLVRSGIYLMLLVKSWKNDLANLQQNTREKSGSSPVDSLERNDASELVKQPNSDDDKLNKLRHIEESSEKTLNSYGISSSTNTERSSCISTENCEARSSSNLSPPPAAESSGDDDIDYVTREALKQRSEKAWLRRRK